MSSFRELMESAIEARGAGQYQKAQVFLKKAVDICGIGNVKNRLTALMELAQVNEITGEWVDVLMYLDNIIQTATDSKHSRIREEALITSGNILSKKGKWSLAEKRFHQVLDEGERASTNARALVGIGIIYWRQGEQPDRHYECN